MVWEGACHSPCSCLLQADASSVPLFRGCDCAVQVTRKDAAAAKSLQALARRLEERNAELASLTPAPTGVSGGHVVLTAAGPACVAGGADGQQGGADCAAEAGRE